MHWAVSVSPIFGGFAWATAHWRPYVGGALAVYALFFALFSTGRVGDDPVLREFYQSGLARILYAYAARTLAIALTVEFLFGRALSKCCVALPAQALDGRAGSPVSLVDGLLLSLNVSHTVVFVDWACIAAAFFYAFFQWLNIMWGGGGPSCAKQSPGRADRTRASWRVAVTFSWALALIFYAVVPLFFLHLLVLTTTVVLDL